MIKRLKSKPFLGLYIVLLILIMTACGKSQSAAPEIVQESKTNLQIVEPLVISESEGSESSKAEETASEEQVQSYLAEVLEFPEYYGKNLDALFDCLTELGECTITFKDEHILHQADCYGVKILQVFEEATQVNSRLKLEI